MIPIPKKARIFLHGSPVDLRNGFEGLTFAICNSFKDPITDNAFYVFINNRRTRIKVLYWNGDDLSIWYIRSKKGVFTPPRPLANSSINRDEFRRILKGKMPKHLMLQR